MLLRQRNHCLSRRDLAVMGKEYQTIISYIIIKQRVVVGCVGFFIPLLCFLHSQAGSFCSVTYQTKYFIRGENTLTINSGLEILARDWFFPFSRVKISATRWRSATGFRTKRNSFLACSNSKSKFQSRIGR